MISQLQQGLSASGPVTINTVDTRLKTNDWAKPVIEKLAKKCKIIWAG